MRPYFSVVMNTYNRASMIANAIRSIRDQTFDNWELIIVDDGSTDHTEDVVASFDDSRIRYYKIAHAGIPTTRNYGDAKANAEIIVMQDSDDLSMPDRLEKIHRAFEENIGMEVLSHGMYENLWDEKHGCVARRYIRPPEKVEVHKLLKEQLLPSVPAYKKHISQQKPFREETKYAFDYMMYLDWALSGFDMRTLDEGLYEYVRHQGSHSMQFERDGLRQQSMEKIKEIVKKEYGEEALY